MKQAIYYAPGATPKAFAFEAGSEEGKINLVNAEGRVVVRELPVATLAEPHPSGVFAVIEGEDDSVPPTNEEVKAAADKAAAEAAEKEAAEKAAAEAAEKEAAEKAAAEKAALEQAKAKAGK
jgi:hypothetical protein